MKDLTTDGSSNREENQLAFSGAIALIRFALACRDNTAVQAIAPASRSTPCASAFFAASRIEGLSVGSAFTIGDDPAITAATGAAARQPIPISFLAAYRAVSFGIGLAIAVGDDTPVRAPTRGAACEPVAISLLAANLVRRLRVCATVAISNDAAAIAPTRAAVCEPVAIAALATHFRIRGRNALRIRFLVSICAMSIEIERARIIQHALNEIECLFDFQSIIRRRSVDFCFPRREVLFRVGFACCEQQKRC